MFLRLNAYFPPPVNTRANAPKKYSPRSSTAHPPVALRLRMSEAWASIAAVKQLKANISAAKRVPMPRMINAGAITSPIYTHKQQT